MSEEVHRSLGQIEAKVDILLTRSDIYDKRLNTVEKKMWWSSGAAAVIAFIATNILRQH
jgi:hypothetical protein